jgi:hypothetical protein
MLPTCSLPEILESRRRARAPAETAASRHRDAMGDEDYLDAARGIALSLVAGGAGWLLLAAFAYWLSL